jgi:tetratricopeptide (TPR) repeat protein
MRAVVDHYLRIVGSKAPPTAIMRMRGGKQLGSLGLVLPAVVELDSALSLDPKLIEARMALAELYRNNLRFDDALAALDAGLTVLKTLPEGASAYSPAEFQASRCAVLYGLERDKEAGEACQSARAGGHPHPMAQAMVALAQGRKPEAIALLESAAKEGGEEGATAKAKLEALKNEK